MTHVRRRRQERNLALIALQASRLSGTLAQAYSAVELTLPDGYPSGRGEPISGGDTSNPVLEAILTHEAHLESVEGDDEARLVGLAAVDTSLTVALAALGEAHAELSRLAARLHGGKALERSNIVDCEACGRSVANTPNDRLRKGYCNACRMAWERQGQPDRVAFNRTRRDIDTAPTPLVRTSGAEVVDLTHAGVTVRLPVDLAFEWHTLEQPTDEDIARLHAEALERVPSKSA